MSFRMYTYIYIYIYISSLSVFLAVSMLFPLSVFDLLSFARLISMCINAIQPQLWSVITYNWLDSG